MSNDSGTPLTITAAGMNFAALVWGKEGNPVILAFHGWLDNAASFSRLAPLLTGYRVIAVDLAGHGLSDHRGKGADYPLWSYVPDMLAVMDELGLEKVNLLGHSMGAVASCILTATRPDRVSSLMMIDGLWPLTAEPPKTLELLTRAIAHRSRKRGKSKNIFPSMNHAVRARCMGFRRISSEAAEIIVRRGTKRENDGWVWRSDSRLLAPTAMRFSQTQARDLVAAIQCSALLIVASRGMLPELVEKNRKLLHHIHIAALDGDHHLHMEEGAGSVAEAIVSHLTCET